MLKLTTKRQDEAEKKRSDFEAKLEAYNRGKDPARIACIKAAQGDHVNESVIEPYVRTVEHARALEDHRMESVSLDPRVAIVAELTCKHEAAIEERKSLHTHVHGGRLNSLSPLASAADHAASANEKADWQDWEKVIAWRKARRAFEDAQDRYEHLTRRIRVLESQIKTAKQAAAPSWTPDPTSSLPPHQAFPLPSMPTED